MLFLTIVILSTSLSFKYEAEKRLDFLMPFDAKIELNIFNEKQEVQDIKEALERVDFQLSDSYKYAVLDWYYTNIKISDLLNEYGNKDLKDKLKTYVGNLGTIKISQY